MIDAPEKNDALQHHGLRAVAHHLMSRPVMTLIIFGALMAGPGLGDWCFLAPDSIAYLTNARSLHETGEFPRHFLMRPPGFPLVLAPLMAMGDLPLLAIRLLLAGCHIATGALIFKLCERSLGKGAAFLVGILTLSNTALLNQTTVALSELVFIPVQLLALIAMDRLRMPGKAMARFAFAGLLAGLAVMVRTIGMVLLPAGFIVLCFRKGDSIGRRLAYAGVFLASAGMMPLAWHLRQARHPETGGYARMWTRPMAAEQTDKTGWSLQAERFARFGFLRLEDMKSAVLPNRLGWRAFGENWSMLATVVVSGVLISILLYRAAKLRRAIDLYALLVLAVLALWPWDEGARLVVPLIPMFYAALLWPLFQPMTRRRPIWRMTAVVCIVAVATVHVAEWTIYVQRLPAQRNKARDQLADMREFAALLERAVPRSAELLCITPNGHNSKRLIAGGAYLARRQKVAYRDVIGDEAIELHADPAKVIVLERSLRSRLPVDLRVTEIARFQDLALLIIAT